MDWCIQGESAIHSTDKCLCSVNCITLRLLAGLSLPGLPASLPVKTTLCALPGGKESISDLPWNQRQRLSQLPPRLPPSSEIPSLCPPGRRCGSGRNCAKHLDANCRTWPMLPKPPNSPLLDPNGMFKGPSTVSGQPCLIWVFGLQVLLWVEGSLSPSLASTSAHFDPFSVPLLPGSKNLRAGSCHPDPSLPPWQPPAPTLVASCTNSETGKYQVGQKVHLAFP